jgi:hypothetical protein
LVKSGSFAARFLRIPEPGSHLGALIILPKNICLWAAILVNPTHMKSAIYHQPEGGFFGQHDY